MTPIRGKMVRLDGKLVIRYEAVLWSEPTRQILYWPLSEDRSTGGAFRLEGHLLVTLDDHGGWGVAPEDRDFWVLKNARAVMLNGGKTEAVRVEREPISCPKVRAGVKTRWYEGEWQKLTKKGWVRA